MYCSAAINKLKRAIRLYHHNSSLRAYGLLISNIPRRIFAKHVPEVITIGVTSRCQCKCVHCSSNIPNLITKPPEMDSSKIKELIDHAKSLGILRVTFFGGEPLLREDIIDLIRYAHNAGLITRINTNGLKLTPKFVLELKNAGLTMCDVSIDDPDPEIHDKLRGVPGIFNHAIEGMKNLIQAGILCQIVTYASRDKLHNGGLQRIIDLGRELHAFAISIVFPMATGCWLNSFKVLLSSEEKEIVRSYGDSSFVHVEIPTKYSTCNVGKKKSIYVSPEGEFSPCPFISYSMGNVYERSLIDQWHQYSNLFTPSIVGDCLMNYKSVRDEMAAIMEKMSEQE